jgi:hypothetical protein
VETRRNGKRGRPAQDQVIFASLAQRSIAEQTEKIARKVVTMAKLGDLHAVNIIADGLDGKPHQSVDIQDKRTDDLAAAFEQILASTAAADKPEPILGGGPSH